MLTFPNIDPVALALGPIKIHWYGLMYLFGFTVGWLLLWWRGRRRAGFWHSGHVGDLVFYVALGVIIGGRVGYMLFYDLPNLIQDPIALLQIYQGGMSFHGGLLGVILAMWIFARRHHIHFGDVSDFVAPVVPIGLGAGRFGNFINGELWGRVSDVPWAMTFPSGGMLPRHPSQLYEFFLEGVVLFIILWWYSAKPRPRLAVSGWFALLYGIFRFSVEFFRQPDWQLGFIAFDWLTMGMLLTMPVILTGLALLVWAYSQPVYSDR